MSFVNDSTDSMSTKRKKEDLDSVSTKRSRISETGNSRIIPQNMSPFGAPIPQFVAEIFSRATSNPTSDLTNQIARMSLSSSS